MRTTKITIEHEGKSYSGEVMRIKSTSLGYEDHGILTAFLHCEGVGSGIGVGGYCLDEPRDRDSHDYSRVGTAFGLDHVMRLMETVGVDKWEKLPGKDVVVLFEGASLWGGGSVGIAGLLNDHVLILKDHAESFRARESVEAAS